MGDGPLQNKSKQSIIHCIFSTLLIPFQCVMLPLVDVMSKLHLMNRPGLIFMYIGLDVACQLSSFMVLLKIFQLNWKKRQQSMDVICFKHFSYCTAFVKRNYGDCCSDQCNVDLE